MTNEIQKDEEIEGGDQDSEEKKEQETTEVDDKPLIPLSLYEKLKPKASPIIGRLILIAKIPRSNSALLEYFDNLTARWDSRVTGLLLAHRQGILCVLESESAHLLRMLKMLQQEVRESNETTPKLENVKLVAFSDDCHTRIYPVWASRQISTSKESNVDLSTCPIFNSVYELSSNIWSLGHKLNEQAENAGAIENELDSLKQKYPELLPSNERILAFSECNDIMDLEEFMSIYTSPITMESEADVIWPAESLQQTLRGLY